MSPLSKGSFSILSPSIDRIQGICKFLDNFSENLFNFLFLLVDHGESNGAVYNGVYIEEESSRRLDLRRRVISSTPPRVVTRTEQD